MKNIYIAKNSYWPDISTLAGLSRKARIEGNISAHGAYRANRKIVKNATYMYCTLANAIDLGDLTQKGHFKIEVACSMHDKQYV